VKSPEKAILALEDGRVFRGYAMGARGEKDGEVVFNTSMTGYQEVLTDPSYKGQIVVMTYPLIGNYGINNEDVESFRPHVEGFVVKELSPVPSSWRHQKELEEYLQQFGIIGMQGVDTRSLTLHIRSRGAMKGIISSTDLDERSLVEKARLSPGLIGRDLVKEVSCNEPFGWNQPSSWDRANPFLPAGKEQPARPYRIAAMDYGIKYNILRKLVNAGCEVRVFPANATPEQILEMKPEGLFLSNGPGDPEGVPYAIETIRELLGKLPIFGICLGHQLLGLAFGGRTFKLKFGHRGANHPVKDIATGKVDITCQNHGFCVDIESLKGKGLEITHINLNDQTLEGMHHVEWPIFSVQYHPEASPGPHDAHQLFARFIHMMMERRGE
jgi:carbamoyl-phosphate synthase small subunit